jgi:hypothetical protein
VASANEACPGRGTIWGNMSNDYQMVDGSPRYGFRSEANTADQTAPGSSLRNEEPAEGAARLGLDHLAAAITRRLTSAWADKEHPLVAELRRGHPKSWTPPAPWSSCTWDRSVNGV